MGLDIYFNEDITNRLAALALANSRAMDWARQFGADRRDVAIVQAAYEAALADVGVSFGVVRTELLIIFRKEVMEMKGQTRESQDAGAIHTVSE